MKVKTLFRKAYTLNHVRDRITVKEGNETIELHVDCDPKIIIHRIQKAQETLLTINEKSSIEDRIKATRGFAVAIFGDEQTRKLFDFYHGDDNCVIAICGMYFKDQKNGLAKKITKAQKRMKHATV